MEAALDVSGMLGSYQSRPLVLDRIATHILAGGHGRKSGHWHWFEGNFASYQADREKRLGLKPQVRTAFTANLRAIRELVQFTCCYVTGYIQLSGSTLIETLRCAV